MALPQPNAPVTPGQKPVTEGFLKGLFTPLLKNVKENTKDTKAIAKVAVGVVKSFGSQLVNPLDAINAPPIVKALSAGIGAIGTKLFGKEKEPKEPKTPKPSGLPTGTPTGTPTTPGAPPNVGPGLPGAQVIGQSGPEKDEQIWTTPQESKEIALREPPTQGYEALNKLFEIFGNIGLDVAAIRAAIEKAFSFIPPQEISPESPEALALIEPQQEIGPGSLEVLAPTETQQEIGPEALTPPQQEIGPGSLEVLAPTETQQEIGPEALTPPQQEIGPEALAPIEPQQEIGPEALTPIEPQQEIGPEALTPPQQEIGPEALTPPQQEIASPDISSNIFAEMNINLSSIKGYTEALPNIEQILTNISEFFETDEQQETRKQRNLKRAESSERFKDLENEREEALGIKKIGIPSKEMKSKEGSEKSSSGGGLGTAVSATFWALGHGIKSLGVGIGKAIQGVLTGIAKGIKAFGSTKVLKGILAMGLLGVAMVPFAFGLQRFTDIEWDEVIKGGAALVGFGLAMTVLGKMGTHAIKGALAVGLLGLALIPLAFGISMFTGLDWDTFTIGLAALAAFGVVGTLLGVFGDKLLLGALGIGALGLALIPFAYAMNMFTGLEWDTFFIGIAALGAFGVVAALLGGVSGLIIAGALAIGVLGLVLAGIGFILAKVGDAISDTLTNTMDKFIELSEGDPSNLGEWAKGIGLIGAALALFTGADVVIGVVGSLGNVVKSAADWASGIFGGEPLKTPMDMLVALTTLPAGQGFTQTGEGLTNITQGLESFAAIDMSKDNLKDIRRTMDMLGALRALPSGQGMVQTGEGLTNITQGLESFAAIDMGEDNLDNIRRTIETLGSIELTGAQSTSMVIDVLQTSQRQTTDRQIASTGGQGGAFINAPSNISTSVNNITGKSVLSTNVPVNKQNESSIEGAFLAH